jgi:hypothetical protein
MADANHVGSKQSLHDLFLVWSLKGTTNSYMESNSHELG